MPSPDAPVVVVGTPVNQFHELGALLAATTASSDGWRVVYLGANLPADELARAARYARADARLAPATRPQRPGGSSAPIVAVLGARSRCSRAATRSACSNTRSTLPPANCVSSSAVQPRRAISAKSRG